jgi:hypothetical protein
MRKKYRAFLLYFVSEEHETLMQRVKRAAFDEEVSMNTWIYDAIRQKLQQQTKPPPRRGSGSTGESTSPRKAEA